MPSFGSETGNVLYLIVCGAPLAAETPKLVEKKQAEGWDVCVIATPSGLQWFEADDVEVLTGHDVRSEFRSPISPEFQPKGDAILVCPATFNTINKWSMGLNDSLALGLLNEALGGEVPIEIRAQVNPSLSRHPAYSISLATLAGLGVEVLSVT